MSINCRNGGVLHEHDTVDEVRQCHGMRPDAPIKNVVPQGPKPGDPDKAKRIEAARKEEARNTALARAGQPHGFTSDCPQCVGIGAGHAVVNRAKVEVEAEADPYGRLESADEEFVRQMFPGVHRARQALADHVAGPDERTAFLNAESSERPARNGFAPRPNKYGGTCVSCKQYVKARDGLLGDKVAGKFTVRHKDGECPEATEPEAEQDRWKRDEAKQAAKIDREPLPDVPEGHYAITSLTGNNDLDFFRVDRPERDGRVKTFIKRVIGGKPNKNIKWSQYHEVLNAILKAGVEDSARLYGQAIGQCSKCNRHLTDEESRRYGRGPDCRAKYGLG